MAQYTLREAGFDGSEAWIVESLGGEEFETLVRRVGRYVYRVQDGRLGEQLCAVRGIARFGFGATTVVSTDRPLVDELRGVLDA